MKRYKRKNVGCFFNINKKKYVTKLNYTSIDDFKKLIDNYSHNAYINNDLSNNSKVKFIDINDILYVAEKSDINKKAISLISKIKYKNNISI